LKPKQEFVGDSEQDGLVDKPKYDYRSGINRSSSTLEKLG